MTEDDAEGRTSADDSENKGNKKTESSSDTESQDSEDEENKKVNDNSEKSGDSGVYVCVSTLVFLLESKSSSSSKGFLKK